jgi:hypothetical protein
MSPVEIDHGGGLFSIVAVNRKRVPARFAAANSVVLQYKKESRGIAAPALF